MVGKKDQNKGCIKNVSNSTEFIQFIACKFSELGNNSNLSEDIHIIEKRKLFYAALEKLKGSHKMEDIVPHCVIMACIIGNSDHYLIQMFRHISEHYVINNSVINQYSEDMHELIKKCGIKCTKPTTSLPPPTSSSKSTTKRSKLSILSTPLPQLPSIPQPSTPSSSSPITGETYDSKSWNEQPPPKQSSNTSILNQKSPRKPPVLQLPPPLQPPPTQSSNPSTLNQQSLQKPPHTGGNLLKYQTEYAKFKAKYPNDKTGDMVYLNKINKIKKELGMP